MQPSGPQDGSLLPTMAINRLEDGVLFEAFLTSRLSSTVPLFPLEDDPPLSANAVSLCKQPHDHSRYTTRICSTSLTRKGMLSFLLMERSTTSQSISFSVLTPQTSLLLPPPIPVSTLKNSIEICYGLQAPSQMRVKLKISDLPRMEQLPT
jgi:hypothetical protein